MNDTTISCPVCGAAVPLGRRTMGDLIECQACRAGFRVRLGGGTPGMLSTSVEHSGQSTELGPSVKTHFDIVGVLGKGGQATVYRVRPRGNPREYALKYLDPITLQAARRSYAEQELTALLDHPNIVALHATGVDETHPYAVYEIVEGQALSDLIERGPLPIDQVFDIAFQVLAGLTHSHDRGVVHRDIKPQNILLTHDGVAKIADFGIGRLIGSTDQLNEKGSEPFVGTPGYAAPEQINGWGSIRASDVYAFGVMLYEMVTGRLPFVAPSLEVLLRSQVTATPRPPIELRPDLPAGLNDLIMACLAKSPARRPRSAGDLAPLLRAQARALSLPVLLDVEPEPFEPPSLLSLAGVRAAGLRLVLAGLVVGAPLAFALVLRAHPAWASLAVIVGLAWLGVTVGLACLVGVATEGTAGTFLRTSVLGEAGYPGGEKILAACMICAPLLILQGVAGAGDAVENLVPYMALMQMVGGFVIVGPVSLRWIEDALLEGPKASARLEVTGPRDARVRIDGGVPRSLPVSVWVRPGIHRIAATLGQETASYTVRVTETGRYPLAISEGSRALAVVQSPARSLALALMGTPLVGLSAAIALCGIVLGLVLRWLVR